VWLPWLAARAVGTTRGRKRVRMQSWVAELLLGATHTHTRRATSGVACLHRIWRVGWSGHVCSLSALMRGAACTLRSFCVHA
jgi:hypothetical protein